MSDLTSDRQLALTLATQIYGPSFTETSDPRQVVTAAGVFWKFLTAPVILLVTAGPVVDQTTGRPTNNPGGTGMVAIKDTEKFPITLTALDAKGNVTTPPLDATVTSADNSVLTVSDPDTDGVRWGVGGNPGSTVLTGDWPDSPLGDLQGTLAVDVTAGDASSLVIEAGDAVPQ